MQLYVHSISEFVIFEGKFDAPESIETELELWL